MCGLSGFRAKAVITFESLQFKETLVFGFPRSARSCVIAFGDSGDFRQINHPFTVEIFPGIVIAHLMFGRIKDKPSLFPTFDFEIGLQKIQIKKYVGVQRRALDDSSGASLRAKKLRNVASSGHWSFMRPLM